MYYILLDEVQLVDNFVDVLNGFLHIKNVDTYVTGSNAKFLSKDIITEFRGRGDQIHIYPLSFSEFASAFKGPIDKAWNCYMTFGGLPKLFDFVTNKDKAQYLKDIKERNKIINDAELDYRALPVVHNGGEAMDIYPKMLVASPEEKERIRNGLLQYCCLDILAMVKVLAKIKGI